MHMHAFSWFSSCFECPDCLNIISLLQRDIIAESEDILKLGLLFGEDINATTEDFPAVLGFQHKLIQEYLAAVYIAKNVKLDPTGTFLREAFPTWHSIENHKEIVQFACGILADTNANAIINHIARVQHVYDELDNGRNLPDLSILQSCQKESGLSVAEVLANTELAFITDIDENDTLQLRPSSAQIIVKLGGEFNEPSRVDSERIDRLLQALKSVQANVIALYLYKIKSPNVTRMQHFCQLKHLHIEGGCGVEAMIDLAESIQAWGPQPQLKYCMLWKVPISSSVMTALSQCTQLMYLNLRRCNLHDKLSIFMSRPPAGLRDLILWQCSLDAADLNLITQTIREGCLTSLEELNIQCNPVGETAVGRLMEALISTRPPTQLTLLLGLTGVDEAGKCTVLSEQFQTEWEAKLTGTTINVEWF